jgi:LysR family transcriptional regulator, glycine cleavage system transcriptional activator
MSRLPLNTLPTFRTVAQLENLRAAAEQLHLTHSALSQQIRLLEEHLGHALFDRQGRRLVLNPAGRALLSAVEAALEQLDDGVRAAAAIASGQEQRLRLTLMPSFAQRWLLPRMGRWRSLHPDIVLEIEATQRVIDLPREGFHVALRVGAGQWRGLVAERLIESPLVALGTPSTARRLRQNGLDALCDEPLLGSAPEWERFLALAGVKLTVKPVADFNDGSLMLQATEQELGIALVPELLAADALRDGRLERLSPIQLADADADAYWFVYPPALAGWPPLLAFRAWLHQELEASRLALHAPAMQDAARGTSR